MKGSLKVVLFVLVLVALALFVSPWLAAGIVIGCLFAVHNVSKVEAGKASVVQALARWWGQVKARIVAWWQRIA